MRDALAGLTAEGGTATGEGVFLGAGVRARRPALPGHEARRPRRIVLLTDGKASNGRDVLEVARQAQAGRHPGPHRRARHRSPATCPGGGTATTDHRAALRQVAEISGGQFRTAEDADQLNAVYDELGSRLSTKNERRQVTQAAAGAGLLLLLAGAGFSLFSFGRLP